MVSRVQIQVLTLSFCFFNQILVNKKFQTFFSSSRFSLLCQIAISRHRTFCNLKAYLKDLFLWSRNLIGMFKNNTIPQFMLKFRIFERRFSSPFPHSLCSVAFYVSDGSINSKTSSVCFFCEQQQLKHKNSFVSSEFVRSKVVNEVEWKRMTMRAGKSWKASRLKLFFLLSVVSIPFECIGTFFYSSFLYVH